MEKVRIVRDKELLNANRPTRRNKRSRSIVALEEQDREGYLKIPQSPGESRVWDAEVSWPEE